MSYAILQEDDEKHRDCRQTMNKLTWDFETTSINGRKRKQVEDKKEVTFNSSGPTVCFIESLDTDPPPLSPSLFRLPSMIKERQTSLDSDASSANKRPKVTEEGENAVSNSSVDSKTKFDTLTKEQVDGKFIKSAEPIVSQ